MAKPEQKFLTDLKKAFKRQKVWFYKIPDTPPTDRFTPAKPFDAVLCVKGNFVAAEGKWLDWTKGDSGFSYKMLRDSQKLGLSHVSEAQGLSFVVLGLRAARGDIRALFFEHSAFKKLCDQCGGTIPKAKLLETPYFPLRKDKGYDLTEIVENIDAHFFYERLIA